MPPRLRQDEHTVAPLTHGVEPRCTQTSGIFGVPAELIIKILTNFGDPHRNIRHERCGRKGGTLFVESVERLTVIRKLTMTCWHLRNMLFPLLWEYVEGCNLCEPHPDLDEVIPLENGLYAQCLYLIHNPTIGAYVRTLSVDLRPTDARRELITTFVDCLVRLPNLRTLDIFRAQYTDPVIMEGLKRQCAQFPSITELFISNGLVVFVGNCPNVKSVTIVGGLFRDIKILTSHGERLRRVAGVYKRHVCQVVKGCPNLQEFSIQCTVDRPSRTVADTGAAEHLRSLKHLTVVDLDLTITPSYPDQIGATEREVLRTQAETDLKAWKGRAIGVLKDSPSKGRKFLRWTVYEKRGLPYNVPRGTQVVLEEGELEMFPETSL